MRDRDRRASLGEPVERFLYLPLGLVVERARGLVEDEDRRVAQDGARDRDPLLLAAREAVPALADDRVVALRERRDQPVDLRGVGGCDELLFGRVGLREAQVVADRGVEQVRLLRHDADERRKRRERQVAQVDAADRDAPLVDVVEARGEVAEGRLPRAGLTDERRLRAGRHGERHVAQRPRLAPVAEPDVPELDVAGSVERLRIGTLLDVDRLVEVLEDPVEERERGLHVEPDPEQ